MADLGDLRDGNIVGIDAADAGAFPVHVQHDLDGLRRRFVKDLHEDLHDKIHRRVMVVVQDDPEHAGLFETGLGIDAGIFLELPLLSAIIRHGHTLPFPSLERSWPLKNDLRDANLSFMGRLSGF